MTNVKDDLKRFIPVIGADSFDAFTDFYQGGSMRLGFGKLRDGQVIAHWFAAKFLKKNGDHLAWLAFDLEDGHEHIWVVLKARQDDGMEAVRWITDGITSAGLNIHEGSDFSVHHDGLIVYQRSLRDQTIDTTELMEVLRECCQEQHEETIAYRSYKTKTTNVVDADVVDADLLAFLTSEHQYYIYKA